eukprot:CAMPEP_0197490730 /NCGR_PEP_ID=MMETSP1311-20131121/5196_1 /TAXON_ID=464262 /ORGANISM="Genus nov. species nov., Strain RCC856" /LENGTH=150 /DNA_ID=CAMNT_0043035297 /DNA_START=218 /DNA_END=671 /DNA_ORIENTATION=-
MAAIWPVVKWPLFFHISSSTFFLKCGSSSLDFRFLVLFSLQDRPFIRSILTLWMLECALPRTREICLMLSPAISISVAFFLSSKDKKRDREAPAPPPTFATSASAWSAICSGARTSSMALSTSIIPPPSPPLAALLSSQTNAPVASLTSV